MTGRGRPARPPTLAYPFQGRWDSDLDVGISRMGDTGLDVRVRRRARGLHAGLPLDPDCTRDEDDATPLILASLSETRAPPKCEMFFQNGLLTSCSVKTAKIKGAASSSRGGYLEVARLLCEAGADQRGLQRRLAKRVQRDFLLAVLYSFLHCSIA